jgi:hypothetical protein
LVADAVRGLLRLRIGETVARERVDVAERVAEFVVEERSLDSLRQGVADVAHLLAHLIPRVPDLVGRDESFTNTKTTDSPGFE